MRLPGVLRRLKQLQQAGSKDAEILFLRLMIPHHQGGVQMAQAAGQSSRPQVSRMAGAVLAAQEAEIDLMRRMLAARGAAETVPSG